jgi:hypothetical protein
MLRQVDSSSQLNDFLDLLTRMRKRKPADIGTATVTQEALNFAQPHHHAVPLLAFAHDACSKCRWCRRLFTDVLYSARFRAPASETAFHIWSTDRHLTCICHLVPCAGAHLSRELRCGYAGQPGLTLGTRTLLHHLRSTRVHKPTTIPGPLKTIQFFALCNMKSKPPWRYPTLPLKDNGCGTLRLVAIVLN